MEYTASWQPPHPPPQHQHHPHHYPYAAAAAAAAPPQPSHYPVASSTSYISNPNPTPNLTAVAPDPYTPHGGYTGAPTASAASAIAGGAPAPYYYEVIGAVSHSYGHEGIHQQYGGVIPIGYGQFPLVPSNGMDPAAPPFIPPPQWGSIPKHKGGKKKGSKKTKAVQPVQPAYCGVCKIDCTSQEVLNAHKQGKKHKKNLQKLQEAITPRPPKPQVTIRLAEAEAPIAVEAKAAGKKKKKRKNASEDLETKKRKMLEEGAEPNELKACTICNVVVNSQTVYEAHIMGSKHAEQAKAVREASVADQRNAAGNKKNKRKNDSEKDLETKKRKMVEGGAEPNEVKVCTICNVVVNSQTVYDSHIMGSKHAAMVKKHQEAAAN